MSNEETKNEISGVNSTANADKATSEAKSEKESASGLNPELVESLEDLPPEVRSTLMASLSSSSLKITSGSRTSLVEKFNDEHIHKYLDYI